MNLVRSISAAAVFVLAAATVSIAQDGPEVVRYQLDNGLEVLLAPDHKVPKVGLTLVYRVGGMNEPAGRSGFAHLFEHLMFSGTPKYPEFDDVYSALGASNNAFTEEDRTIYVVDALASALPVLLSVEADRMANLGGDVDQTELDLQRDVVKNEMRQNVLDSAGQPGNEAFRAALFPAPHPYAESVIGSIADLDAAQLEDVKAFFNAYYVPNNAILSLAGDFDVEAVKAMIADTFGRVPRGADVALPEVVAARTAAVRIDVTDRLPTPIVALGVAGPAVGTEEATALMVAGDMLGNYEYGMLRRQLVNTGLAVSVSAGWDGGRLGGRFIISANAAPGVTPEALEAALRKAVADFAAVPLLAEDVERARRSVLLERRTRLESMMGRSQVLAIGFDLFGEKSPWLGDDPVLVALTPEGVSAAFRKIVVPEALSVLTIMPGERGDYPAVLKASSGVPTPIDAAERPLVDVPALTVGQPGVSELPPMETAELSNGIRLVHYRTPGSPIAYVGAVANGGDGSDKPGQEGLISLAATMMSRGAGERGWEAFSKAAKDIGADIVGYSGWEQTIVMLSVPPEALAGGVDLLADAVLRPRFESGDWAALMAETQQGLMYRKMDPASLAYFTLEGLVFSVEEGRPALEATVATVSGLSVADARAVHGQQFQPRAVTMYSVGAMSLDEVRAELDRAFGSWKSDGAGMAPMGYPPAVIGKGRKVYVTPSLGNSQAIIELAQPAPAFDEPGVMEAIAVARVLGSDPNSRLNAVLRETKGYSYGVSASVFSNLRTHGLMLVTAPVQADKVGEALTDLFAGFDGLTTVPVSDEELQRTVMATASGTAGTVETSGRLFGQVVAGAGMGLTLAELNDRLGEIVALQLPQVQHVANSLAGLDHAVVVIAGDPQVIVPQLEAIGITDVTVLPPEE